MIRVNHLAHDDRVALCEMLEDEHESPQTILRLYRRPSSRDENLVAWHGERIVGLLTGTLHHDFSDNPDFRRFHLPRAQHALLTRVIVRRNQRLNGVGQALVSHFVAMASEHGCDFIGGYLDDSSDKTGRRSFFEKLGFTVDPLDSFGARPAEVRRP